MTRITFGIIIAVSAILGFILTDPAHAENTTYGTLRITPGAIVCLTAPANIKTETGAVALPKGSCVTIQADDPVKVAEVPKSVEPACPTPAAKTKR